MEILQKLAEEYGRDLPKLLKEPQFFIENIMRGIEGIGITNYQKEWINLIHNNQRLCIQAFRSSGKTRTFIRDYIIFRAFTQPGFKGVIIAPSMDQAVEIMKDIRSDITMNPLLRTSIPKNRYASWSKTALELSNGSRLLAKPYNERIRGIHVDHVVCDEGGEYQNIETFKGAITPIVRAKNGSITVIGTPKHALDLLHDLSANKHWTSYVYAADMMYKGKPLWNWRYDDITLEQVKKEMGNNLLFTREYLMKCVSGDTQLFPVEFITAAYDYEDKFINKPRPECFYYISLDFALSGKSGADYSAYFVFEVNKQQQVKVVRIERYKGMSYSAQKLRIKQLYDTFKPVMTIGDEGNFGIAFIQDLRSMGVPMTGFKFQTRRIELLEVFRNAFDQNFKGGVELPKAQKKFLICKDREDNTTTMLTNLFQIELESFNVVMKRPSTGDITGKIRFEATQPHDDMVMSCAIGWWYARGSGVGTTKVVSHNSRNSGLIRSTRRR